MSNARRHARRERALTRLRTHAGVTLSRHALSRAKELGFDESEVLRCVISPEQTYGGDPKYPGARRVHQRRDCACVIDTATRTVVTVLLRNTGLWQHGTHTRWDMPRACSS